MQYLLRIFRGTLGACALLSALLIPTRALAQGCVAARGSGIPANMMDQGDDQDKWETSISYRWFQSDRHYVGTAYQAQRDANGDQVINRSNFMDFGINYTVNSRWNVSATVPFVANDRSQVVKDSTGKILDRYHTQAYGLADMSFSGNYWLFNPETAKKGNIQIGLGVVLPTGKHDVKDTFESYDKTSGKIVSVVKAVDESIQPGQGGYGISFALNLYRILAPNLSAYGSAYYEATPQEQNDVGNSISDTYLGRTGLEYSLPFIRGVSVSLGLRVEGVMVYDLFGGSNGFRRPGYSVAIDPGVSYSAHGWTFRLYVPTAIQRDRLQSYPDKLKTWQTGKYTQGDAAFADYLIQWSISHRF
ncbi:MAG TPA: hypothetical protein VHD32_12900 [Candidatus Didemnitutus sp.]|nr:hypothetical protein [Candidatus Didemnitutus sp.]